MAVPAIPANPTTVRQLPPIARGQPMPRGSKHVGNIFKRLAQLDLRSVRVQLLAPKVLFSGTAILYHGTKIFLLDTLLTRNAYKIIKLIKRLFSFADKDNTLHWRAMLTDQKARHVLLKITYNCFGTLEGIYDLLTRNEIVKMAYAAFGLGVTWQPFSASVMSKMEFCLTPLIYLKWANCASHFFLATRSVWKLDRDTSPQKRYANWVNLGKAALDFGIASLKLGLNFAGIATGSTYTLIFTHAFLSIISNSLGMVKFFTTDKPKPTEPKPKPPEDPNLIVLLPVPPTPEAQPAQAPPVPGS